ncbi:MAG TPA: 50S ribosomal protein L21 [Candidatus Saccharimonadales bacterium]|nr:50S ribosomal protein L21 [Candidatus Saccharimonadales bacterium]
MKAVIEVGNKQYIVAKGDKIEIDLLPAGTKKLTLEPLMVFDENNIKVGTPKVDGAKVEAKVLEERVLGEKLQVVRFKAKKRVKKISGHRQKHSLIEISSVA